MSSLDVYVSSPGIRATDLSQNHASDVRVTCDLLPCDEVGESEEASKIKNCFSNSHGSY